jgi:hypothetical protein
MRRFALALPLAALAAIAPIAPACSSSPSETPGADAGEAGAIPPEQLEGKPCNPLLSDPCYPVPCSVVTCDPVEMTCEATPIAGPCHPGLEDGGITFEASTVDAPVISSSCTSDEQCPPIPSLLDGAPPTAQVCAFSAFDGCSASGACVVPSDPPLKLDGAVDTACGCNGQPVQYVTDMQTAAPVSSPAPCAKDAGTDAATPGPDGGSPTDAAVDAPSDASDDGG